jgi:hypothetical protein
LLDKTEKLRLYNRYAEALALQPEEISRYLRESKFIEPFAIEFLAAMLDHAADTAWKLAFSQRRRGRPSPSKNEARLYSVGEQVERASIGARKAENAVEDVAKELGISRATAHRGLKFYRQRKEELANCNSKIRTG